MARLAPVLVLLSASVAVPELARADDLAECNDAYAQARDLRTTNKLGEAQHQAGLCQNACDLAHPDGDRHTVKECAQWFRELDQEIPTIVYDAIGPDGLPTSKVKVSINGAPQTQGLDGNSYAIDPGDYAVRFELEDAPDGVTAVVEQRVTVRRGAKNQVVHVEFRRADPTAPVTPNPIEPKEPAPTSSSSVLYAGIATGVVGVVGAAIGGALMGVGSSQYAGAEDDGLCSPTRCNAEGVQVRTDASTLFQAGGGVLIGAGVVATVGIVMAIVGATSSSGKGPRGGDTKVSLSASGVSLSF